ncbi:FRG domain-containing protein [Halomonas sp. MES3-P3E]|uniref:FRG domain-containing protein n=1 Tax=Halomonas sp. MES3-P3E TaxID=2058321 RepID=UPI000C3305B7|nr:FRG domain-containing protein [Halomonas sp. MES3-P3E]PKG53710.1 FRG domain-containing protein [Halomonas sp. MES3-P3E]
MEKNWENYKKWIAEATRIGQRYYYRGQSEVSWKLKTSFHRNSELKGISLSHYFDKIMKDVNYQFAAFDAPVNFQDNVEYLTFLGKLQHHGFPTPLLDWTLSGYVAAFFAFKGAPLKAKPSDKVSIFIFDVKRWSQQFSSETSFLANEDFVSDFAVYATGNQRMVRQMAVTTATNVSDLESFIVQKGQQVGVQFLWRYDMPASERTIVMKELDSMGINDMTLFPDFDGLCQHLKEMHFTSQQQIIPPPPPPSMPKHDQ